MKLNMNVEYAKYVATHYYALQPNMKCKHSRTNVGIDIRLEHLECACFCVLENGLLEMGVREIKEIFTFRLRKNWRTQRNVLYSGFNAGQNKLGATFITVHGSYCIFCEHLIFSYHFSCQKRLAYQHNTLSRTMKLFDRCDI